MSEEPYSSDLRVCFDIDTSMIYDVKLAGFTSLLGNKPEKVEHAVLA